METAIEVLKKVFSYGSATNTHLDILDYLQSVGVSKEEYITWGRNALNKPLDSTIENLRSFFKR